MRNHTSELHDIEAELMILEILRIICELVDAGTLHPMSAELRHMQRILLLSLLLIQRTSTKIPC